MTLTYRLGNALYINLTNKCTNACSFCIRLGGDTVGDSGSLWLEREPDKEEVLADIFRRDLSEFQELVFCGYGEPMMRLDDLVWIAAQVKRKAPNLPIRVNTNGQAELFYGPDAARKARICPPHCPSGAQKTGRSVHCGRLSMLFTQRFFLLPKMPLRPSLTDSFIASA